MIRESREDVVRVSDVLDKEWRVRGRQGTGCVGLPPVIHVRIR